jgi:hypothetical protein
VRLPDHIVLLADAPFDAGPQTASRLVSVQIGDPAWEWRKPLVHVAPAGCDPERFRAAATRWLEHAYHRHLALVLHVEPEGEPYALLGYDGARTLAMLLDALTATGRRLALAHAKHITDAIASSLSALHAADLAHGDVRAEQVYLSARGEVKLGLGIPWDGRATAAGDLRAARELCDRLHGLALDRPPTADLASVVGEVLGPEPDPFAGRAPARP